MAAGEGLRRRCGVAGSPIAHSLSPVLHRAGYAHLGLDWEFAAYDVDEAALPAFVAALAPPWRGLALTMPLKQAVMPLLDAASEVARRVGAANTLLLEPDGRRVGDNTDVPGITAALTERGVAGFREAAVLGGGATARSAVAALAGLVEQVVVYVRSPQRAAEITKVAAHFGVRVDLRPWDDVEEALAVPLVIATTPAGVLDPFAASVHRPGVLFDVVYDPWPTPLAVRWVAAGGKVIGGLDLLVHQAALQFRLMTGREVPVEVLRSAGEAALAARTRGTAEDR